MVQLSRIQPVQQHDAEWHCVGQTSRGASHQRHQTPNQDAIRWFPGYPKLGRGTPLILAVADGHGSPKSFRSDLGAQFAVRLAEKILKEALAALQLQASASQTADLDALLEPLHLPQRLVRTWSEVVGQHWQQHPVTPAEWAELAKQQVSRQAIETDPAVVYGATLLVVAVTDWFVLYMQLGDGDILAVDRQGEVSRPLRRDERLIANETTSLCTSEGWRELQIKLVPLAQQSPELILVTTDGYANSYPAEAEFIKIGPDYLNLIQQHQLAHVVEHLPEFLAETSREGSGDDITIGLIYRSSEPTAPVQPPEKLEKPEKPEMRRSNALGLTTLALTLLSFGCNGWLWNHWKQTNSKLIELQKTVEALQSKPSEFNQNQPPENQPPENQPSATPADRDEQ